MSTTSLKPSWGIMNKSATSLNSQDKATPMPTEKSSPSSSMLKKFKKRREKRKDKKASFSSSNTDDTSRDDLTRNGLLNNDRNRSGSLGSQQTFDDSDSEQDSSELNQSTTQSVPITISTSIDDPTATPTKSASASVPDILSTKKESGKNSSNSSQLLGSLFSTTKKRNNSIDSRVDANAIIPPDISENGLGGNLQRPSTAPGIAHEGLTPPSRSLTSTPLNRNWGALGIPGAPETVVTPPTPIEPTSRSITPILGKNRMRNNSAGSSTNNPPSSSKVARSSFAEGPSNPLTPTIEVPTPQATPTIGQGSGGFFTSMFSVAQNAANTIGNTINTGLAQQQQQLGIKGKKGGLDTLPISPVIEERGNEDEQVGPEQQPRKVLAVETLGQGELSLGHLGLESSDDLKMGKNRENSGDATGNPSTSAGQIGLGVTTNGTEPIVRAETISAAFDTPLIDARSPGFATPPQQVDDEGFEPGHKRSNSIKSGGRSRRKRGSSAATSTPSLNNDKLPMPVSRATGFAAAPTRRNDDFHKLFRSVPDVDRLVEDYGCALQKEILLQGRMYVSEQHICFNSNIFGWVTTLVISFDEIVSIEKKTTAVVFPNAIVIQTLHARNVFASFISRDSTYDLIVGIWRTSHPHLQSSVNGVRLGEGAVPAVGSESGGSNSGSYDSDDDDDGSGSDASGDVSASISVISDRPDALTTNNKSISKKPSSATMAVNAKAAADAVVDAAAGAAGGVKDYPGPAAHAPTVCGDDASHLDKPLVDEVISAPLGKVYNTIFGDASFNFLQNFLSNDQKVLELSIPENGVFKDGIGDFVGKKTRCYNYIKPLSNPMGPKQTKCLLTEIIEQQDFEKVVSVAIQTQTPDVPNGNIFKVLARYCLTWADNNSTRVVINCTVEWSGKSWIKGPIEKGSLDGQTSYTKDLIAALRREFTVVKKSSGGGGKGGKKKRRSDKGSTGTAIAHKQQAATANSTLNDSWGILSPLKSMFSPFTALLGDLVGVAVGLCILGFSIFLTVRLFSAGTSKAPHHVGGPYNNNMAFWNEIWMKEETALWEWLDDRARVRGILDGDILGSSAYESYLSGQKRKNMEERLKSAEDAFGWREQSVEEAIRVTEDKLEKLKKVVAERKVRREEELQQQQSMKGEKETSKQKKKGKVDEKSKKEEAASMIESIVKAADEK